MKILFLYNRFENLGIEVLSSFLKSHGHEVKLLLDPQLFNDGYSNSPYLSKKFDYTKDILKDIGILKPDLIAFSVLTDNYQWALNLANKIKKISSIPIVFGGVHSTSLPKKVVSNECVDFIIRGEGEYAFLELINALEKNKDYSKIKNLVFKKNNKIIQNEVRNLISNLDELPFPDKEIFYNVMPISKKIYTVMTARGCPFSCTYCFNHVYKKIYAGKGPYIRKRSVDNVIDELKKMKDKYNYKFVSILDDVFLINKNWLKEFCSKYKKIINVPFRCMGHVNYSDEETIKMLKDAGCNIIQIGVQTTCDNTRKNIIHRYEDNETVKKACKIIKDNKIKLEVDHIIGFPYETEKEQIESAKIYNEIRPDIINCYWLKCFPKTDIIKHMKDDNKLTDADVEKIEEGLTGSIVLGGDVKDGKNMKKFFCLFNMIPLLPKGLINQIIKYKLYHLTNFGTKFMVSLRAIKSIFWLDVRLVEFTSFYKHYVLKKLKRTLIKNPNKA